ncbi:MAG: tRNA (adenosine(37)-N6)-threonylcarbamoyltransferase complex transferase subunit TsaD [Patescibacteria group bacterium]|nr:tRNA (adenosine(37)-N6)-threonylcarbamoyltransferase complex transferase subunit TsaD [Patescibacteria group bacterium]MDE1944337.1 tRNA (adenosine(37)-N6)-threonylcarbamoyltransferase complex transferase subunit TsaD [Patescibacteria group bacterium]MDE2057687.1 tRNA (adenosine(37)-N6)-threonylcarbamoyltransferase complex transferase subunit TsaD [Patescibacteria group bacterium]
MKILAIETSCDETAIAIVEAEGDEQSATFRILGNALLSQVELHKPYGGVYPNLAKREHAKNLVPILEAALEEAELLREDRQELSAERHDEITRLLEREPGLSEAFLAFAAECERPAIDAIAVTAGPGLEPALWVGVNFAKALAVAWGLPILAVNHMEGHIFAALAESDGDALRIGDIDLPVLALLISGGHTELVLMREFLRYELIGQTRDDAVGEAFDKVARLMGLPYPGGPEISKLAETLRRDRPTRRRLVTGTEGAEEEGGEAQRIAKLPRPMLHEPTCDFSFSGLKTAVRVLLANAPSLDDASKEALAREFEDAVTDVLWAKTARALEATGAPTLAIGGGVSANAHTRRVFAAEAGRAGVALRIPEARLTTDNALMIALAGYYRARAGDYADPATLRANGNLRLA